MATRNICLILTHPYGIGGAIAFSPWVEVTHKAVREYKQSDASRYDILDVGLLEWGVDAYPPVGELFREAESFVSPLHHPFKSMTPLYIEAGSKEGFYESIASFAKQMLEVEGN